MVICMLIILLLCVLGIGCAWNLYYKKKWDKNIAVTLHFNTQAVYAGEMAVLYEVIENRKSMPVPVLEVGFHARKELVFCDTENTNVSDFVYKRDIFSVLGRQKITRQIRVHCTKRGYYRIKEADLTSYPLLHGARYGKHLQVEAELYVYPARVKIADIMAVCERMLGTLQCSKGLYEDPFAFRTIREYTFEDPMKTINWKASAKTGKLMVNTFDSVLTRKAIVYLDIEDSGVFKRENLVEESISVAATLVRKLYSQGMEVGFSFNGKTEPGDTGFLPCSNEKTQLVKLERMLARYQSEAGWKPFAECFGEAEDDTVLLFITKNLTKELYKQIADYVGGERMAMIVCPHIQGELPAVTGADRGNIRLLLREVERS